MIRTFKLGIAVVAVLVMSVIGAAAAQAGSLDVGASPAWLTGSQVVKNKLTVTSAAGVDLATVKFGTANYDITTSTTSVTHMTSTPTIGECELGALEATCSPGTCRFTLSGVGTPALTFDFSITSCTSVFTITQGACVLTIPSTGVLEKVLFSSVAGAVPKHVLATLEVKKIPVEGDVGCPAALQAAGNTGDLSGTITTKAFSDVSGVEGAQVNLEAT